MGGKKCFKMKNAVQLEQVLPQEELPLDLEDEQIEINPNNEDFQNFNLLPNINAEQNLQANLLVHQDDGRLVRNPNNVRNGNNANPGNNEGEDDQQQKTSKSWRRMRRRWWRRAR